MPDDPLQRWMVEGGRDQDGQMGQLQEEMPTKVGFSDANREAQPDRRLTACAVQISSTFWRKLRARRAKTRSINRKHEIRDQHTHTHTSQRPLPPSPLQPNLIQPSSAPLITTLGVLHHPAVLQP